MKQKRFESTAAPEPNRWSGKVTKQSNALDLEEEVFKSGSAKKRLPDR